MLTPEGLGLLLEGKTSRAPPMLKSERMGFVVLDEISRCAGFGSRVWVILVSDISLLRDSRGNPIGATASDALDGCLPPGRVLVPSVLFPKRSPSFEGRLSGRSPGLELAGRNPCDCSEPGRNCSPTCLYRPPGRMLEPRSSGRCVIKP